MPLSGGGFLDITFELEGQQAIIGKLHTAGARIEDMSEAWEQVGTALLMDFTQNFRDEGGVFGRGAWAQWAPLRPATVADRQRRGYPGAHPILVRTGDLMESVTQRGAPGNVFEVGRNSLVLGTTDYKAKFHQFGRRDGRMPARKIVGISNERRGFGAHGAAGQAATIIGMLQAYVNKIIREQGLQG